MEDGKRNGLFLLTSVLLLAACFLLLDAACWASYAAPYRIHNETDQTLSIFVQVRGLHTESYSGDCYSGDVLPGEVLKNKCFPAGSMIFLFTAKNKQGDIVYSREFAYMETVVNRAWDVIIRSSDLKTP